MIHNIVIIVLINCPNDPLLIRKLLVLEYEETVFIFLCTPFRSYLLVSRNILKRTSNGCQPFAAKSFHSGQSAFGFYLRVYREGLAVGVLPELLLLSVFATKDHPTIHYCQQAVPPKTPLLACSHWYGIFWLVLQRLQVAFSLRFNCQLKFCNLSEGLGCKQI